MYDIIYLLSKIIIIIWPQKIIEMHQQKRDKYFGDPRYIRQKRIYSSYFTCDLSNVLAIIK